MGKTGGVGWEVQGGSGDQDLGLDVLRGDVKQLVSYVEPVDQRRDWRHKCGSRQHTDDS